MEKKRRQGQSRAVGRGRSAGSRDFSEKLYRTAAILRWIGVVLFLFGGLAVLLGSARSAKHDPDRFIGYFILFFAFLICIVLLYVCSVLLTALAAHIGQQDRVTGSGYGEDEIIKEE